MAGLTELTLGIKIDKISFCPKSANAFLRWILEYKKKAISAGITKSAYKNSGFAILNISFSSKFGFNKLSHRRSD